MPAIVGAIKIISVGSSSIVHIGDSIQLAPVSSAKTFAGAGSFNTGDNMRTYNSISSTNTYDSDAADSNVVAVNPVGGV
ncbi:spore germination protein [Paenibacillus tarimensis]